MNEYKFCLWCNKTSKEDTHICESTNDVKKYHTLKEYILHMRTHWRNTENDIQWCNHCGATINGRFYEVYHTHECFGKQREYIDYKTAGLDLKIKD